MPCAQIVKQLANNQISLKLHSDRYRRFMACLEEVVISVCALLGNEWRPDGDAFQAGLSFWILISSPRGFVGLGAVFRG